MTNEFDNKNASGTPSQKYLGSLITTRDIDSFRREELERQDRIFNNYVVPYIFIGYPFRRC